MNINEAKIVSFVTNLVGSEISEITIMRLLVLVKNCYPVQVEAEPTTVDLKHLFDAMLSNRKIDAIKEYRQLTRLGLKDSKDEVEWIMNRIKGE